MLLLAGAMLTGTAAFAGNNNGIAKVARTPLPYWLVGDIDKRLSKMCSAGQFNQRTMYRFSGHFYGPNGSSLVGAAKGTGLNLFDPYKKATQDRDYWFFRDRTSACIVFSARVKEGDLTPTPVAAIQPVR